MIKTVNNEVLAQSITVAVVLVTDVRSISASSSMVFCEYNHWRLETYTLTCLVSVYSTMQHTYQLLK